MQRHDPRNSSSGSLYSTRISKQLTWWLFTQWIGIIGILLVRRGDNVGVVTAFEWSSAARRPEVNRQAIAGIWKLTPTLPHPLKEFTVYPKKPRIVPPELLLLLKEDGSFQQYESMSPAMTTTERIDEDDGTGTIRRKSTDIDASWRQFQRSSLDNDVSQEQQRQLFPWVGYIQKGKWDYLDGNLLLAADRIDCKDTNSELTSKGTSYSALADGTTTHTAATRYDSASNSGSSSSSSNRVMQTFSGRPRDDTLLKGRVIANYQTRLDDNPILSAASSGGPSNTTTLAISQPDQMSPSTSSISKKVKFDTYLSVPRGSIQIGKFMYPKHHPSFFEQPMFQPMKMGNFALRQILGTLNAANPSSEDEDRSTMEQFQRSDFYNRTFLLTSSPLRQLSSHNDNNRGEKRWSIKYNDYVYDAPSSKKKTNAPTPDDTPTSAVRVLQIVFHRNNTFSTTGGLGNAAILRGKFDIIGNDKDHLWMQVIRFGFGRSVSGSVYSEGPMLSHEDIKAYWGKIRKVTTTVVTNSTLSRDDTDNNNNKGLSDVYNFSDVNHRHDEDPSQHYRMEVEGSVLDGLGLEPMPVARFLLREIDSISTSFTDDDDDDEEEEDDDEIDVLEASTSDIRLEDDGVDWTSMGESFQ